MVVLSTEKMLILFVPLISALTLSADALIQRSTPPRSSLSPGWGKKNAGPAPLGLKKPQDDAGNAAAVGSFKPVTNFDEWLAEFSKKLPIFEYANLSEFKAFSLEGVLFLLTNVPFVIASQMIRSTGTTAPDLLSMAASLDISFVFSMLYHFAQLWYGPNRKEVRRFLFFDYISAFFTCTIVTLEVIPFLTQFHNAAIPLTDVHAIAPVFLGLSSLGCLGLAWVYEYGRSYLFWHGAWHILSAYTTVLLAQR